LPDRAKSNNEIEQQHNESIITLTLEQTLGILRGSTAHDHDEQRDAAAALFTTIITAATAVTTMWKERQSMFDRIGQLGISDRD
jgi:hypothetical protein